MNCIPITIYITDKSTKELINGGKEPKSAGFDSFYPTFTSSFQIFQFNIHITMQREQATCKIEIKDIEHELFGSPLRCYLDKPASYTRITIYR